MMDQTTQPTHAPDVPDGTQTATDSGVGIVDAVKALGEDDLTTLMHGISPDAIEVLERIPELTAFANYIEHGDTNEEQPEAPPANTGPQNIRASVQSAMAANMPRAT